MTGAEPKRATVALLGVARREHEHAAHSTGGTRVRRANGEHTARRHRAFSRCDSHRTAGVYPAAPSRDLEQSARAAGAATDSDGDESTATICGGP